MCTLTSQIQQRSRKYLRFLLNGQTFQFTALPFSLATAPLEFTKVAKEIKQSDKFVLLVLGQTAWAVDALSLVWENLDAYAFPPVFMLSKVIARVMD